MFPPLYMIVQSVSLWHTGQGEPTLERSSVSEFHTTMFTDFCQYLHAFICMVHAAVMCGLSSYEDEWEMRLRRY